MSVVTYTQQGKRKAYLEGLKAKKAGWTRTSPFYEDWVADRFFHGAYDGVTYEEINQATDYGPRE